MRIEPVVEPGEGLPSALPSALRRLLAVAVVVAAFVLANTVYLLLNRLADAAGWDFFAAGSTSLPEVFQVMVLAHTAAGALLALLAFAFAATHLPKVWSRYHGSSALSGAILVTGVAVLLVTGLFILTAAASRANRWAWWAHVLTAVVVPAAYVLHRVVSYTRPRREAFGRFGLAVAGITALLVAGHLVTNERVVRPAGPAVAGGGPGAAAYGEGDADGGGATAEGTERAPPGSTFRRRAAYAGETGHGERFVPAAYVPPGSPFFPTAATTTTGDTTAAEFLTRASLGTPDSLVRAEAEREGFVSEARIGAETCARCHAAIVEQWSGSAHRFASFNNPFYEATIDHMRRTATRPNRWVAEHVERFEGRSEGVGRAKSKWCAGCHDPALLFSGRMGGPVDRNSREAQAGLTCMACHGIDEIHDQTGNGAYNLATGERDPYLFADARAGTLGAFLHDAALKAKPEVHKRQRLKPVFKEALFCSACHKVSLPEPVNNYRWLRGQDEYDNWHDSGVPRNASRTFYLPGEARVCQDCHMPSVPAVEGDVAADGGRVRSHRFLAVNTALPFVRGDTATIRRIEEFLRDEKLRVDVFAVSSASSEEPALAVDRSRPALAAGERARADVVVRNQGVGHTFPGGTNDSNEGWLEFTVADAEGDVLAVSGRLGPDGHLEPMAHDYRALILDRNGDPIHMRNAQDIHVAVYANVIGPGTADVVHYEFEVPPELAGSELTLRARLLWRKFDRAYTEFAYGENRQGFKRFSEVPDLPVTEIAADSVRLAVEAAWRPGAPRDLAADSAEWVRFNDYGIALLLEGDTRGAFRAFGRVADARPDRIDGPLNLARTAIRDGALDRAYRHLGRVEEIEAGNARAAWVWGRALQEDGRYDRAVGAYRRVLEVFPDDRAAWRNLGRTHYLAGDYREALEAFGEVLRIDPEDRVAHYHRMLCYSALGMEERAELAREAYEHYRVDESAQELTREYRLRHPAANLETQPIHVHRLVAPGASGAPVARAAERRPAEGGGRSE